MLQTVTQAPPVGSAVRGRCRTIVMCSPKGGTGKTTFSQNFLSLAAEDKLRAIGVDLDPQGTLAKWWEMRQRRHDYEKPLPPLPEFDLLEAPLREWRRAHDRILQEGYDLVVYDVLPSVNDQIPVVDALCREADLVVVTTGITTNDMMSVLPWVRSLKQKGMKFTICLNRANRREVTFIRSRSTLNQVGPICPVEVRQLADAYVNASLGEAAVDRSKNKLREDFLGVWHHVRREIGLEVAA